MFKHRSDKKEIMDDFLLQSDELKKNLDELDIYNRWLGGKQVLISSLNYIYRAYPNHFKNKKIIIGDLGCGSGDLLRAMDKWVQRKKISAELIGVDANQFMINYGIEKSSAHQNIQYKMLDIFSNEFAKIQFDIICLNNICHHFNDEEFIHLLKQLAKQTQLAIIVNDLHRHWFSYFAIKGITTVLPFSYLSRHDGPLSVLRAFTKQELVHILREAHLNKYQIRWAWTFRWAVIIMLS
ncbi:MAG: methyltransferase domain-containing protein [Gammaproteobacteria bacterium]|nr:methyltransferase domain-containing protein [Gammaproteobacteria bacterium]MCW5583912.1 methyltransferase domain-containing protein [Gammaproteobacteria bacterium]